MRVKKLEISNFKGVGHAEYDFSDVTTFCGVNASGKTTVADAWFWLWCDKDYNGRSNPAIRTIGNEDAIPTVTATCDVDGKKIVFVKTQERSVSGKDDGTKKVAISNKYTINGTPKTERDVKKRLLDFGIDVDNFFPLSNPESFVGLKNADMRKTLFSMASEKTPEEIANGSLDTLDIATLLTTYTMDEISAMYKATKKKADEEIKGIPWQVTGMEEAKNAIDVPALEKEREEINERIAKLTGMIEETRNSVPQVQTLKEEYKEVQHKIIDAERHQNRSVSKERREIAERITRERTALATLQAEGYKLETQKDNAEYRLKNIRQATADLRAKLANKKAEEFNVPYHAPEPISESAKKCPTCGQPLPEERIKMMIASYNEKVKKSKEDYDLYKRNWEGEKRDAIKAMVDKGNAAIAEMKTLKADIEKVNLEIAENKEKQSSMQSSIDEAVKIEKTLVDDIPEDTAELVALRRQEELIGRKIGECESAAAKIAHIEKVLGELRTEDALKKSQIGNVAVIDQKIADLVARRDDLESEKAEAEKILYQLDLLKRRMNEALSEEINSHFKVVKFLLFDYQKNGEYKEVCIPTIDGKRFGESLNTGREIVGKLDICESLQRFFGMQVPIFLDGAEALNEENVPKLDTQLVMFRVTEDPKLVVRNGDA